MLQQDAPEDYVIATGRQHSVREFVEQAGAELGYSLRWKGAGLSEQGYDARTGRVLVRVDPRYFRPAEVDTLLGDASKARQRLGWSPRVSFAELVKEMVAADVSLAERDAGNLRQGYRVASARE